MEQFVIRAYGFNELARLYFPDVAPKSASNRLRIWLKTHPNLLEELKQTGYARGQKVISPKQVELIIQEFGMPYTNLCHEPRVSN